jgi:hypothetical protein
MRRGARGLLAGVVLVATLSGCKAHLVAGSGFADTDQVVTYQAAQFDAAITALDTNLDSDNSLRGTVFKHATFGSQKEDAEWDDYVLGSPPAVFIKSTSSRAGDNLDTYHPAGSPVDYVLLGDLYKALEPTPWVSLPTAYSGSSLQTCQLPGIQTVCDLEDTIKYTKDAGGVPIVKQYTKNSDGTVTMLTAVTLASMLKDNYLLDVPSSISTKFTASMMKSLIPLRINLDKGGNILQIELDGTVSGPTPFIIQVGYQVTGTTIPSDFPPPPSVVDVTVLPTQAAADAFYKAVAATS